MRPRRLVYFCGNKQTGLTLATVALVGCSGSHFVSHANSGRVSGFIKFSKMYCDANTPVRDEHVSSESVSHRPLRGNGERKERPAGRKLCFGQLLAIPYSVHSNILPQSRNARESRMKTLKTSTTTAMFIAGHLADAHSYVSGRRPCRMSSVLSATCANVLR